MNQDVRDRGRDGVAHGLRQAGWTETYARLSAADRDAPLEPAELERLATAAYLIGRDVESTDALARAYQEWLRRGDTTRAARCAFWTAFALQYKGERAGAAGWVARAQRLLDEHGRECAERGYLLVLEAIQHVGQGDFTGAHAIFTEVDGIGERFADRDLMNLGRHGRGRTLIRLGETARGVALLDEVMVAVTAGELSAVVAGPIYCSVIAACFDIFDLRRAQEWTEALRRWCESQADEFPYRGQCRVYRAEIMRLRGVWPDAMDEARRACASLSRPSRQPAIGAAFYQLAELHRLRGECAEAEEAYREASQAGRTPHPGLAQLRLAQGRIDAAKAAICRVLDEVREPRTRSLLLGAAVEILIEAGDVAAARGAADELTRLVPALDTPFVRALSAQATGAVRLAEGDAKAALGALRQACIIWRDLDAPYDGARVTLLIGLACRALGDDDSGEIEIDAARHVFQALGAAPDLERLERLRQTAGSPVASAAASRRVGAAAAPACGLTGRELQVLRLVASGRTNRAIADALGISERTVARHLSNIFTKLDLSSRAAATAYAFQHDLIEPTQR